MLDNGAPFCTDWAEAARTVGDVVQLRAVPDGTVRRDPADPRRMLVPIRSGVMVKAGRRLRLDLQAHQWLRGLRKVQAMVGPLDILHGHFFADARPLPFLARRLDIPFLVTEHSTALMGGNVDNVLTPRGRKIARSVYRDAAFVLPVSQRLAGRIQELELPGRLAVVPNPVDVTLFRAPVDMSATPRRRLVTVARLAAVKRLDVLLRSLAALRRPDVELTIIGGGVLAEELQRLAAAFGVADQVRFLGHLDRTAIAQELARAHASCSSSVVENLPVAVIEALCCGLPVLATQVGGLPELVGPQDGLLVPPDDVKAFTHGLQRLLDTPWDRAAISERARGRFSLQSVGQQLASLYEQALADARRR